MFRFLQDLVNTQDGLILFILACISVAMVFDFLTGVAGAKINPDITFQSKAGINGILRKISSVFLLVFFIPLSVLLPDGTGIPLLYTLYIGYLFLELKSIIENMAKMGIDVELFKYILEKIKDRR